MRHVALCGFILVSIALTLLGCGFRPSLSLGGPSTQSAGDSTSAIPASQPRRISIASARPVDAYVLLGGRIKTCWFNANAPLLPKHVYRANVSPDGSKVQITIHEKLALGRAGLSTYAVDFRQEGGYTVVTTENRKMPPDIAAKMQYDIDRWKRGEAECNSVMPAVAEAPAAAQ
jgi:hypothetical protein